MADKTFKINIVTDSNGLVTISKGLEDAAKQAKEVTKGTSDISNEIVNLKAKILDLTNSQKAAYEQLQQKLVSSSSLAEKGIQNQGLAWYNAERSAKKYNSSVEVLNESLNKAKSTLKDINVASTLGYGSTQASPGKTTPTGTYASFAGVAGFSQTNSPNAQQQDIINGIQFSAQKSIDALEKARKESYERQIESTRSFAQHESDVLVEADSQRIAQKRRDTQAAFEEDTRQKEVIHKIQTDAQLSLDATKKANSERFKQGLSEQEIFMKYSIDKQIAEERYGANSIQKLRVEAAEASKRAYTQYAAEVKKIQEQVNKGGLNKDIALVQARTAQEQYKKTIVESSHALNEQEAAHQKSIATQRNLFIRIGEIIGIYRVYNATLNATIAAIVNIPKAGISMQATQASIFAIFGTEQGQKNLMFLRDIAKTAGQDIRVLEETYRRFAPSAIIAGARQEEVNKAFRDFAEVGTVLHLPEDKLNSLFLALDQMYAKGVVQSEEIKKQLGNVLPGAVEIGAKAMGKTPAAFMEAMKNNEVTAKEFVPKFAELYRKIFGGVDDKVFTRVQDMLFANLMRTKNNYELLSRDIFNLTQETMNNVVKVIRDSLDSVRQNLTGITQAVDILATFIEFRLGGAALAAIPKLAALLSLEKVNAFSKLIFGISAPAAATTAAMVGLYASLNNLSLGYDKATGFTVTYKNETVTLTSYLESTGLIVFDKVKTVFGDIRDIIKDISGINLTEIFNIDFSGTLGEGLKQDIAFLQAAKEAVANPFSAKFDEIYSTKKADVDASFGKFNAEVMKKAGEKDSEAYVKSFANKTRADVIAAISSGKLTKDADIGKALGLVTNIQQPQGLFADPEANLQSGKQSTKAAKAVYKAEFQVILEEAARLNGKLEVELATLTSAYQQNAVSIKEYYETNLATVDRQAANTELAIQKELALAKAHKDVVEVAKLDKQLTEERTKAKLEHNKVLAAELTTMTKYREMVVGLEIEYMRNKGNVKQATILGYREQNKDTIQKAAINGDNRTLDLIKSNENFAGVQANINEATADLGKAQDEYSMKLERINVMKNIGAVSELSAAIQMKKINEELLLAKEHSYQVSFQELEVYKEQNKEQLAKGPDSRYDDLVTKVRKAKSEMENFRLTADTVALHFETVVGGAFDSAFVSLMNGTQNGKQAFVSFTNSVVDEINKMVAAELRSAVIMPLLGLAFSAVGGMVGSAIGGSQMSFGDAMSGVSGTGAAGTPLMSARNALGGVHSGNISQYSGTIVDKPTFFAKGGNVMGEAGPEAILPLTRNSKGQLSVQATGNSGSGVVIENINITLAQNENQTSQEQATMIAKAIKDQLDVKIDNRIVSAKRSGGLLNQTQASIF